jgi:lipopolysaccharide/colanic/teichoic acid biosynthesis glycosyltransferase
MAEIGNQTRESVEFSNWSDVFLRRTGVSAGDDVQVLDRHHGINRPQSGLACEFEGGWPIIPEQTSARNRELVLKRVVDVILSSLALFALLPLLLGTAIAVKLTSRGPVLFRQSRPGLHGKPFEMLKFRTMHVEAGDASGIAQTTANDSRLTPIGRFLRSKSIDELPQLINVFKGDMSIIGPRPHVEGMLAGGELYDELVPYYHLRHEMRPGLSGWAQANGLRGPTIDAGVAKARIDHDIAYIQNFSIALDMRIILLTLKQEFITGSGI